MAHLLLFRLVAIARWRIRMYNKRKILGLFVAALVLTVPAPAGLKKGNKGASGTGEITGNQLLNVVWREPTDIRSRNLYYGPGREEHQPHDIRSLPYQDPK